MKQLLVVLLCLLLSGCAEQVSPAAPETVPDETVFSVTAGLYDPNHPMEQEYPGLIRAYPLPLKDVHGIRPLGADLLVLSGQGQTTMTLLAGETLQETASLTLCFPLQQEDPSLQIHENGISFFDPTQKATIVLDHRLRETRKITMPEGISGKPILSSDGETLYYCTGWSVAAWDLSSGIRRTVKELFFEAQELTGLHLGDTILECTVQENDTATKLFLSPEQGIEMGSLPGTGGIHSDHTRYFAVLDDGFQSLLLFGSAGDSPELLFPEETWQQQFYLSEDHAAVTVSIAESGSRMNYYELNTGILRSSLCLETATIIKNIINCKDHAVYILADDPAGNGPVLYRWDVLRQAPDPSNIAVFKTAYCTVDNPDLEALAVCREYAEAIGRKYGIQVHIWEDAVQTQPWDYRFQPEHLAPVLQKELKLLDLRLAQYPPSILEQTKSHFEELTICLVRKITGTGDDRSLSSATGIQFFRDKASYVVITTGKHSEQALYHELYHVMETHILTGSTALDFWKDLNPAGFLYGGNQPEADVYLQGQTRAFVDRYSMYYLKEDRARILENALLPGKQEVFQSEYMQRKLSAMCSGIREAYGLKKHPEVLPWEQYLVNPLAPYP